MSDPRIPAMWHPEWACPQCEDANACYDEGECLAEMDDEEVCPGCDEINCICPLSDDWDDEEAQL